jgi:hypothetical protein
LTKNRSSLLKLSAATFLALLTAGSLSTALAQPALQRSVTKPQPKPAPSVRTSREASLIALNESKLACVVVPNKELFITDVSVVDDCFRTTWFAACPPAVLPATRGAWTFGGLMPGLFGTINPAILSTEVTRWLKEWTFNKVVNGELVPARPAVQAQVINPWLAASGGVQLDMRRAPFRLLAIVSRLDLRGNAPFTAGEGRFVFNLLNPAGNPTEYLLILEYGLDAKDCTGIMRWANIWHGLGTTAFGPTFNAQLQKVTDLFTTIGASPGKPNGSAINQVRSDEIFLAAPWELREFTLQPSTTGPPAQLLMSTVAQTPENAHQNTALLANFATTSRSTPATAATAPRPAPSSSTSCRATPACRRRCRTSSPAPALWSSTCAACRTPSATSPAGRPISATCSGRPARRSAASRRSASSTDPAVHDRTRDGGAARPPLSLSSPAVLYWRRRSGSLCGGSLA